MAYATVAKPEAHMDTCIYDGSSSAVSITGVGFKPDLVFTKDRTDAYQWGCYDSNRGIKRWLKTDANTSENNNGGASLIDASLTSFDSAGFTIATMASDPIGNKASEFFSGQMWKANGGTTSSNDSGSITSTIQANTTAGFSICTYTGNGSSGATFGHGLGAVPKFVMIKRRDSSGSWKVYHGATGVVADPQTDYMELNSASGWVDDSTIWNDTAPTSTLVTLGNSADVNANTGTYVAYCWSQVQGYSQMGTYWGSEDSTDGPLVYCGFRPKFILIKRTDGNENWGTSSRDRTIKDKDGTANMTVDGGNPQEDVLYYNLANGENSGTGDLDVTSTGFKLRTTDGLMNWTDYKYIYVAFAEMPIVGTNGTVGLAR